MDDAVRLPGTAPVIASQARYQVTLLLRNPRTFMAGVILPGHCSPCSWAGSSTSEGARPPRCSRAGWPGWWSWAR